MTGASVVVRCRNEVAAIGRCLRSLRAQTVPVEIVLVDSGSTDGTLEVAGPLCDEVVTLRPEDFTFGYALNVGAERASQAVVFALSAHCRADDPSWVERSLLHYRDPAVAGTAGDVRDPSGEPLLGPRAATFEDVRADPSWGLSNYASSWRRSVWEDFRFDEGIDYCEDKEWMWRVMIAGWRVVMDPALVVASDHRRSAGLASLWRREVGEHRALAARLDFPVPSWSDVYREWWSQFPWPSPHPLWQRRLSPARNVEILGGAVGYRLGARRRGPGTARLPTGRSLSGGAHQ